MERGQKKKLVKTASFLDWVVSFLKIQNNQQQYNQLMDKLEAEIRVSDSGPGAEERIKYLKDAINKIREKSGLITFAQLRDFKDLGLKPLRYPGDPEPTQPITTCKWCGSALNENEKVCHNCGQTQVSKGQAYKREVPEKGESPSPLGTNVKRYVDPRTPISTASKKKSKRHRKTHDLAEHNPDTVKDVFVSEPINQCLKPKRKNNIDADIRKEEIMRSCEDLAIDG